MNDIDVDPVAFIFKQVVYLNEDGRFARDLDFQEIREQLYAEMMGFVEDKGPGK